MKRRADIDGKSKFFSRGIYDGIEELAGGGVDYKVTIVLMIMQWPVGQWPGP